MAKSLSSWVVYMLLTCDGSYYTGSTTDLLRRLREHQEGKGARYTRSRLPLTLCFAHEVGVAPSHAQVVEARIKRLTHSQKADLVHRPHVWANLLEDV